MLTSDMYYEFYWTCIEYGLHFVEAGEDCWEIQVAAGDIRWPVYCMLEEGRVEFRAPLPILVPLELWPLLDAVTKKEVELGDVRSSLNPSQIDADGTVWYRSVAMVHSGKLERQHLANMFYNHVADSLAQLQALSGYITLAT